MCIRDSLWLDPLAAAVQRPNLPLTRAALADPEEVAHRMLDRRQTIPVLPSPGECLRSRFPARLKPVGGHECAAQARLYGREELLECQVGAAAGGSALSRGHTDLDHCTPPRYHTLYGFLLRRRPEPAGPLTKRRHFETHHVQCVHLIRLLVIECVHII